MQCVSARLENVDVVGLGGNGGRRDRFKTSFGELRGRLEGLQGDPRTSTCSYPAKHRVSKTRVCGQRRSSQKTWQYLAGKGVSNLGPQSHKTMRPRSGMGLLGWPLVQLALQDEPCRSRGVFGGRGSAEQRPKIWVLFLSFWPGEPQTPCSGLPRRGPRLGKGRMPCTIRAPPREARSDFGHSRPSSGPPGWL